MQPSLIPALYIVERTESATLAPITQEQAARLLLTDPPPVQYADISQMGGKGWAGYCSRNPDMPQHGGGEVVINRATAEGKPGTECARAIRLAQIYAHEVAHRLTPNESHGAVFAAVCTALTMRAMDDESDCLGALRWYDVQDSPTPGAALDHAISFGREHARSGTPARGLAELAETSWQAYHFDAWRSIHETAGEEIERLRASRREAVKAEGKAIGNEAAMRLLLRNAKQEIQHARRAALKSETLPWPQIFALTFISAVMGWAVRCLI